VLAITLVLVAVEGVICVLMALPFAVPLAMLGGLLGYFIQRREASPGPAPIQTAGALVLILPLMMAGEKRVFDQPEELDISTEILINASPETIWPHLQRLSLNAPEETLFKAGVAYPTSTATSGSGVGATRYCNFSSGVVLEHIEVWNEPYVLRFAVLKQ